MLNKLTLLQVVVYMTRKWETSKNYKENITPTLNKLYFNYFPINYQYLNIVKIQ